MSTRVPDAPTYSNPVIVGTAVVGDHLEGKFSANWLGWLLSLNRAVQDLQASIPVSAQAVGPITGPGLVNVGVQVTMRRSGVVTIIGNVIQNFTAPPPAWQVRIHVDTVVYSTGVLGTGADWQYVITPMIQVPVDAGTHSISLDWQTLDNHGILIASSIAVFPAYTS